MLRVKSFKLSDDKGINEILTNYRLAQGASVFMSNGEICIPYEDGEPEPVSLTVISLLEQKNILKNQENVIKTAQRVNAHLIEHAKARVELAKADLAEAEKASGKSKYDNKKKAEEALAHAENVLNQTENTKLQNDEELKRLALNIQVIDEQVAELRG